MAKFIMHERDIPDIFEVRVEVGAHSFCGHPSLLCLVQVSSLLSSPEMKARKAAGILIGDLEVVEAVLQARMRHFSC